MNNNDLQKNTPTSRSSTLKTVLLIVWLVVFTAIFLYFAISQLKVISSMINHKMTSTAFFKNNILVLIAVILLFVSFVILALQKIVNREFFQSNNHNTKILLVLYVVWATICSAIFIGLLVYFIGALVDYSRQMSIATSLDEKSIWQKSTVDYAFYLAFIASVFSSFTTLAILKVKSLLRTRIEHRENIPLQ